MPPLLIRLRPWLAPATGAVFLALWCVAEAGRFHTGTELVVLAVVSVAIGISRVLPVGALAAVASVILLELIGVLPAPESTTWPVLLGVLIVAFVVAWEAPKHVAFVGLGLALPLSFATGALIGEGYRSWTGGGSDNTVMSIILISFGLYVGAWAIGYVLRVNTRELRAALLLRLTKEQLGAAEVELLVATERDRIARDVHDVLAHSLAVVIAQSDGARFLSGSRPEVTDAALLAISQAARSALIDVRTLIEGLREEPGDQPQPQLADLTPLFDQLASAGLVVDSQHFGEHKEMTPAQQLAVYRVVQESLTNSLRHAPRDAATRVVFDWRGPGLALTVTTTGVGSPATGAPTIGAPGATVGHGIRGMRDRARLAGGWLTAGASDNDFIVTMFVPTGQERTTADGETGPAPSSEGLAA